MVGNFSQSDAPKLSEFESKTEDAKPSERKHRRRRRRPKTPTKEFGDVDELLKGFATVLSKEFGDSVAPVSWESKVSSGTEDQFIQFFMLNLSANPLNQLIF